MSTEKNYNGVEVVQSWSLINFAKEHGLPELCEGVNKETGEVFEYISFPEGEEPIFCHFGYSTQGMSVEDIIREKDTIKVGLNTSGKYTLYKPNIKVGTTITLW